MDDFLDYLTREMDATYRLGRQVWEKSENHKAKRLLVKEAVRRAKTLYELAQDDKLE